MTLHGGGQGRIVLERYQEKYGWGPSSRHISFSVAKSITSGLTGLRIAEKALKLTDVLKGPLWSPQEAASRHITGALPHHSQASLA
jgi:hypothetical protein